MALHSRNGSESRGEVTVIGGWGNESDPKSGIWIESWTCLWTGTYSVSPSLAVVRVIWSKSDCAIETASRMNESEIE